MTPIPAQARSVARHDSADLDNPMRRIAFYAAVVLIFLRFGMVPEMLTMVLGTNTYLLYVFGPPALLGVAFSGGLRRSLSLPPARYWLGFLLFVLLAVPFSSWRGGSTMTALGFARVSLPMLFVAAGLALTWKECRLIMYAVAAGGVVYILTGRAFATADAQGRLSLDFGTMGNANDFAAHLLLVLPFLLFIVVAPGKWFVLRIASLGAVGYGIYLVLGTGSRGALVAILAGALVAFWRGGAKARVMVLATLPVLALLMLVLLPGTVFQRLLTFTADPTHSPDIAAEAAESAQARLYVFNKSFEYTIRHPLFGVGPGQFSTFEGTESRLAGHRGAWHETHSIFTQVSAECGIPAFLFYVAALGSTFLLLYRIHAEALRYPALRELATGAFCVLVGMVCFVGAAAFLNLAYLFHLPCISGVAIAMHIALRREVAVLTAAQPVIALSAPGSITKQAAPTPALPAPQPVRRPYRGSRLATPALNRPKPAAAQPPKGVSALDA